MKSASRFYFEKMTVKAVSAFMYAMEEARALNLRSIGSEFILLGLVKENDNLASTILNAWDVKYFPLQKEIETLHPCSTAAWAGEIRLGFSCKNVLIEAEKESCKDGLDYINTKHLMLAIVRDRDSLANKILAAYDVDTASLEKILAEHEGECNSLKNLEPDPFSELQTEIEFEEEVEEVIQENFKLQSPGNIFASVAWALIWLYLLVYAYYVLTGI